MEEKKKNPELRFEGFTNDWEIKPLENIAEIIMGSSPKSANYNDKKVGLPLLQGNADIKERISYPRIYTLEVTKECEPGDILLSVRAPVGTVAKSIHKACIGRGISAIRSKENNSQEYLYQWMYSFESSWEKISQGGTFDAVNSDEIKQLNIPIPVAVEQQQIGFFFKTIDELITKHQKKHDRLVTLKKSMLEKMFPKEGQSVPEIRFKGFEGNWEECEFQEIATIKRGLTYSPSNLRKTGTRVLRSSNIFENRFINRVDDVFVDDTAINIEYVKEGDILITAANGSSKLVGKHALITGIKGKVVHGGFMLLASSNVPLFLNASMSSSWYKKFVILYTAGGGGSIGNLNKSDLDQQKIYVPADGNEQLKIGKYFQNIDTLITNHLEQLQKLKNFKQSLSEKMFV